MTKLKPVLFIVFNRAEQTKKALESIRAAKPPKLYIAADGPRPQRDDDTQKCLEVRAICENIDWKCEVKRLYQKKNLGCAKGVSGAIDWFFKNEEMGVIIEDDVVADPSYFHFASEMLERYKDDTRIMAVTGRNVMGEWPGNGDYFFFRGLNAWSWATWRRAWTHFDLDVKDWPQVKKDPNLYARFPRDVKKRMYKRIEEVYTKKNDTWDYQWSLAMERHNGLTVVPRKNLAANIGFGEDATHTVLPNKKAQSLNVYKIKPPYTAPSVIIEDLKYDHEFVTLSRQPFVFKMLKGVWLLLTNPKILFEILKKK